MTWLDSMLEQVVKAALDRHARPMTTTMTLTELMRSPAIAPLFMDCMFSMSRVPKPSKWQRWSFRYRNNRAVAAVRRFVERYSPSWWWGVKPYDDEEDSDAD